MLILYAKRCFVPKFSIYSIATYIHFKRAAHIQFPVNSYNKINVIRTLLHLVLYNCY